MPSCATSAAYYGGPPPNNRNHVRIMGSNLKQNCQNADVETKGEDDAGNQTSPQPARSILMSTGTQCEAVVAPMANYPITYVRIRCADGSFSDWIVVDK